MTIRREIASLNDTLTSTKMARDTLERQLKLEQEEVAIACISLINRCQVFSLKSTVSRMASDSLLVESQLRAARCALGQ